LIAAARGDGIWLAQQVDGVLDGGALQLGSLQLELVGFVCLDDGGGTPCEHKAECTAKRKEGFHGSLLS
jgi:hypothetical protein